MHRLEANVEVYFKDIGWEGLDWINWLRTRASDGLMCTR
jgi:hypothetical protein